MATTKKVTEATAVNGEELVEYTAPRPTKEDQKDIFVSVNGRNMLIKRGETVKIPASFKEVLDHAEEMKTLAFQRSQGIATD